MDAQTIISGISAGASVVSAVVAVLAALWASRSAKHSAEHQQAAAQAQQQAADAQTQAAEAARTIADLLSSGEQKRQVAALTATIRAALLPHPRQEGVRLLTISNDGPAQAEILSVTIFNEAIDELAGPLAPATERKHLIALRMGMPRPPWWVRIEYLDGRSEVQEWTQPLSL